MNPPDITIVVCTYNRAAMLRDALTSLYALETGGRFTYEILVVDNASTDATPDSIAAAAAESSAPLRGVREPVQGIVPARNCGIRKARGRWIAFFDDDQLADPRWLTELYRGAAQFHSRIVGGAVIVALPPGCNRQLAPTVRMLLGEAAPGNAALRYGGRLTPGCGNLMIERSVFDEVGMFERTIDGRGEDTDLFYRTQAAGLEAWYLPTAIIHHQTPPERLSEAYLVDLARRMGRGVGERQARELGSARFGLLWTAKLLRAALVQIPHWLLARGSFNPEAALGRRCDLAISTGFLRDAFCVGQTASLPTLVSPRQPATTL